MGGRKDGGREGWREERMGWREAERGEQFRRVVREPESSVVAPRSLNSCGCGGVKILPFWESSD